ncbi:toxin HipA [Bacteroidia bacterium]|nr:toxin HipA [Bacteroidia bacterium]GHT86688.1 toxin HipA [Bacteroidia bacterium]
MDKTDVVEIRMDTRIVGRLALTKDHLCAFEYDTEFIKNGYSVSPYFLPLQQGLFVAKREPFLGGFGVFDDSLPDGWGNLILDRYLSQRGITPEKLTLLQRLSLVGSGGRGALEYFPDKSVSIETGLVDFDRLAAETEKILTSEYTGDYLDTLYKYGGSSGGARPKIFVKINEKYWLVKFKASIDPQNIGQMEYEYSLLARKCGINMPDTCLFENKYFGVERFDRTALGKIHTVSAAGLLNADYRIPSLDYSVLLKICFNLTRDMEEVYALFRLMVFNIAISNRDDHAKNFSFQYKNGVWKLSPAYDILPSTGFNGHHTTTVNGQGEPAMKDILLVASEAGIQKKRAGEIIEQVIETCRAENKLNRKI